MWFFTHHSTGEIIYIRSNTAKVGRQGCDITFNNDNSISRSHALITRDLNSLTIKDANSKYGIFLNAGSENELRISPDQPVALKDSDVIRFGRFDNTWNVHNVKHKAVNSMLDEKSKAKLTETFKVLNVTQANDIDGDVTHLTMPATTAASIKLLQALVMCIPVVTPKYWQVVLDCVVKNEQPLPAPQNFLPKLKEDVCITPGTVSLAANHNRKNLFASKTFVFISASQMENFGSLVGSAGGRAIKMSQSKLTASQCCAKNFIVIQPEASSATQSQNESVIAKIKTALAKKKRRMIPETEIGMAVLHADVQRFCNPDEEIQQFKQAEAQLKIAKSAVVVPSSESFKSPAPPTSRGRVKKMTAEPIECIDLDSDEEMDVSDKENVPAVSQFESIPATPVAVDAIDLTQGSDDFFQTPVTHHDDINIPATEESVVKSPPKVATRSGIIKSPAKPCPDVIKRPSKPDAVEEPPIKRTTRSGSQAPQSPPKANKNTSSASSSDASLFNFSDTSIANRTRKRKVSESADAPGPSGFIPKPKKTTAKPVQEPAPKRNKFIDSDEDEPPRQARKRPAEALFDFKVAVKKMKPRTDDAESSASSGIISLPKVREKSTAKTFSTAFSDAYEEASSSGWLSKKLGSVSLADSVDGTELPEPSQSLDTQDIKPQLFDRLFSIVAVPSNVSISSTPSKRKQFVKKINFKPQSSIVTMKLVQVEDTHVQHEKF